MSVRGGPISPICRTAPVRPTPPGLFVFFSMRPSVFLGLPVYGGYNAHFITSLLELMTSPRNYDLTIRPCIGDSLVARARNRLCAEFLASPCTHMLQIDTDLIFSPQHISRLISHFTDPDVHVVAGLYPKKQRELGWVCNILDEDQEPSENGLQRVKYAGTGCLAFDRSVLTTMREKLPEIEYDPDEGDSAGVKWDFFATGVRAFSEDPRNVVPLSELKPPRRRYLSEDWMFCQRLLDLGFDIWMDTQVIMKHVGEFIYPMQDLEAFAAKV